MAVPAQAQSRSHRDTRHGHHGSSGHHGRGHHDNADGGGLVLGALFVGGLVALAASEKKRRDREAIYYADYETGADGEALPGGSPVPDMPAPYASEYDGLYDEDAAQDRCASAAETEGQNYARLAQVTSISEFSWNGKSWVVKGRLELADGYGDTMRASYKFRCALKAGRAPVITIAGLAPAG